MLTVLLMLDDMNEDNGCLRVVPGSHRGERYNKGEATRIARITQTRLELPPRYEDDSFFGVQGQASAGMI